MPPMFDLRITEEQQALVQTARDFTRNEIIPVAAEHDQTGEFPHPILKRAWETGLVNVEVPEAYGGVGLGCLDHCLVLEEVAYGCLGFGASLAASMLGAMPVIIAGDEEQKKRYLGRLTDRYGFAAACCSEPDAGTDAAAPSIRVDKRGADYVLDGHQRWVINGGVARWYTVLATFDRKAGHQGIACFVLDAGHSGVEVGREEDKLGQRAASITEVRFEECVVPASALIGREDSGLDIARSSFDRARPWIAAAAAGVIRRALDECTGYALERKTFGVPIGQHQAIQLMLAEMAIAHEATRLLCHGAAWQVDRGQPESMASACARAYGADAAMRVTTDAVQLFGGYGYTEEYPVEKLMRDAKLLQSHQGSTHGQRIVIARNLLARRQ